MSNVGWRLTRHTEPFESVVSAKSWLFIATKHAIYDVMRMEGANKRSTAELDKVIEGSSWTNHAKEDNWCTTYGEVIREHVSCIDNVDATMDIYNACIRLAETHTGMVKKSLLSFANVAKGGEPDASCTKYGHLIARRELRKALGPDYGF